MYYRQTPLFQAICRLVLLTFSFNVVHPAHFGVRVENYSVRFDFSFLSFATDAFAESLDELDPALGVVAIPSVPSTAAIVGSKITVRYYVFNLTPRTLDNAVLQTSFAAGVAVEKGSPAGDSAAGTSVWSLGKLSPLDTAVVTVELALPAAVPTELDSGAAVHGSLNGRAVRAFGKAVTLRTDAVDPALLSSVPGVDVTDPYVLSLVSRLKSDPVKIFEYVRDGIGFESYQGALRGARGTIWSEAGNALDRASLLVALYRASGFPARYVRGTLPLADRKRLIESIFHSVEGTIGFVQTGQVISDPANDPALLSEVADHFWIEVDTGTGFVPADPSFPESVIGTVAGTPGGPALVAAPEELHHRITVRLNTEFYSQASALFGLGLGLSPDPVLDQTFRAVDVAGKPLAIGANSASSSIPSPVFAYQAFTYTPYVQITDSDTTFDNDPGFEGVPFTETLTSFPLGSNVLTGLFLQIETTKPDGTVTRAERTLIDRIGFDIRTNGGSPSADFTKPGITSGDVFVVNVVVGEQFKYLVESRDEYLQSLRARSEALQNELTAIGATPSTDPILTQRTSKQLVEAGIAGSQLTTQRFLRESDNMVRVLADTLLLSAYTDSPRLIISSTRFDATDAQNPTLTFSLDLRQDMVRSIASPGQSTAVSFSFNQTRGMMQSQLEGRALKQAGMPEGLSAFSIAEAANAQGIQVSLLSPSNPQDVDLLDISAEAKARISLALADGWMVQVPAKMVTMNGQPEIGWFQMRPDTGETIGVLEDGTHGFVQTVVAYAVFLILGIPLAAGLGLVFGGIVGIFLNGAFLLSEQAGNLALAEKHFFESKLGANPDVNTIDWAILTGKAALELILSAFPAVALSLMKFNVHWLASGAIGIAFSVGFWIGLYTVARACYRNLAPGIDPPVLPFKTAELPSIYRSPTAFMELPLPANIGGSVLNVDRTTDYVRVSGALSATWSPLGGSTFPAQSLSAATAVVRDSNNQPVASGALTGVLGGDAQINFLTAGSIAVNGNGSVSFYGAQSGNVGSATWTALNGTASGGTVSKVAGATLTVGGVPLPAGDYTIEAATLGFSGAGASGVPNFVVAAQLTVNGGALEVGTGVGALTIDGAPVASDKGVGASPFTGSVTLTTSSGAYAVEANGTYGALLVSASTPDIFNITQNDAVEIVPAVLASIAGDYRVEAIAPPGWSVAFAPDGKLTVQPKGGVQSGSFDVHLSLRSKSNAALVAEQAFIFNIGATAPSVELVVTKDAFNTIPIDGVEVPSTFQAAVRNTGPANDTFTVTFESVPPGFEGIVSESELEIGAGQRRFTGAYLKPVGPLPPVGTVAAFTLRAQSQSNGAIFMSVPFVYVIPAIHGVKVSAAPESFSVTPGNSGNTEIFFEAIGNVPEVVDLQQYPQPGLSASGLPPQLSLLPGDPESHTVTLTPDPATPLGTNKAFFFTGTYGDLPFRGSAVIEVRVSAPGADSANDAAFAATFLGYTGIGQTLGSLGGALVAIFLNNLDPVAQSQLVADLNSLMGQLDDPLFSDLVNQLQSVRDGIASGDPAAIAAGIGLLPGLLDQLKEYLALLKKHNFKLLLQPNSQVTSAGQTVSYDVFVTNVGNDTTTIDFSFGSLPGNVTSSFTNSSVTLAPGATSSGFVTAQLSQNGSSIIPFEFDVIGTVTSSPTAILSKKVKGAMTVRDEAVQVTSVKVSPPFVQPGQSTFILAQTLSLINQERPAKIYFEVLDETSSVIATSAITDIVLSPEQFSKFHNLPQLDTTGFPLGNYKVRVRLTEANGTLIPGAENQTNLLIGSPVDASLIIDPEDLAPGDGSVNALLDIRSEAGLATGLQLLGQSSAFNAQGGNFVIKDDRVYIPGGNAGNFGAIVDISNPSSPTPIGTFNGPALRSGTFGGFTLSGAAQDRLVVSGGPGSVLGSPNLDTDVGVFSLANPVAPTLLTTAPASAQQRQFFCGILGRSDDIVFPYTCGFRYFLGSNDIFHHWGGVHSFSVANPAAPQFLNDFYHDTKVDNVNPPITVQGYGPGFSAHAALVSNNVLYHFGTSGSPNTPGDGSGVVKVFNISDPSNPVLDHTLEVSGTGIILSGTQDGNTMLLVGATGSLGDFTGDFQIQGDLVLTLLDVSTPLTPAVVRQQSFPEVRPNYVTRGGVIGGGKWIIAEHLIHKATNTTVFGLVDTSQPAEVSFTPVPAYPGADQLTFQVYEGNLVIVAPPPAGVLIYSLTNTNQADISARLRVPKGNGVSIVPGSFNIEPTEIIPGATFDTLVWDNTKFPLPYLPFHKQFTFSLNIQDLDGVEAREVLNGGTVDFIKSGAPGSIELDPQYVSSGDVIDISPANQSVAPGDFTEYSVTLRNPGRTPLTLVPGVIGVDESWVEFTPSQVTLQQGESYETIMRVSPDSGALLGTRSFKAVALRNGERIGAASAELVIAGDAIVPSDKSEGILVELTPSTAVAGRSNPARFKVKVTNTGRAPEEVLVFEEALGFTATFNKNVITLLPGRANSFTYEMDLLPLPQTGAGLYSFAVRAIVLPTGETFDRASGTVQVLNQGVGVSFLQPTVVPNSTVGLQVVNSGTSVDTFNLSLAGPGAPFAVLDVPSVSLNPGSATTVYVTIGGIGTVSAGDLSLYAVATSANNGGIRAKAETQIVIPAIDGLTARFIPAVRQLASPGATTMFLEIQNLANLPRDFTAQIIDATGQVVANLVDQNGSEGSAIPILRLPALGKGTFLVKATKGTLGTGTLTVRITQLPAEEEEDGGPQLLLLAPPAPNFVDVTATIVVGEAQDNCPADSNKTEPGACGCGVADTDSDGDQVPNCIDGCSSNAAKTSPGLCGCAVADIDSNQNGTVDCLEPPPCAGACNTSNPLLDEDGDGVTNCVEVQEQTDACDKGSFVPRLAPSACAGANGFLKQVNIATVLNHQAIPLHVAAEYRDLGGVLKGAIEFDLGPKLKRDLIVDDMGLDDDTYGTVCIFTNATTEGAWSGGITLYKPRVDGRPNLGLSKAQEFDFALYYPFTNPQKGSSSISLNTNTIGTDGLGTVANWIRLTDAIPGDGRGLRGRIDYFNIAGKKVDSDDVVLPDGGRFDFSGHDALGVAQVGLGQFVPEDAAAEYYIEGTRYFYEGTGASSQNFYTAFALPNRPLTGAQLTGRASNRGGELSVIEIVNGAAEPTTAQLNLFDEIGNLANGSDIFLPEKGSVHRILGAEGIAAGSVVSAQVSGSAKESLGTVTITYVFDAKGALLLAYAPPFGSSAGQTQITEFNSFIGHRNELELINSTGQQMTVQVTIINYDQALLGSQEVKIGPKSTQRIALAVPEDTYGTVIVDAGGQVGLLVRDDVISPLEYILPFVGR